ncbi:MAG: NAD(P)H-dependent oxidoreductase [Bacteroidota bacterium]
MKKIFIINGHQYYPFAEGKLNGALVEKATTLFQSKGYAIQTTNMQAEYNVDEEIEKHLWADAILLQTPVNWMGVTWSFKKYMDEVYTAGMFGKLCDGDGRSKQAPKANYGAGGKLTNTQYMLSLTFNAPKEAFGDDQEYLFAGKSVDDLLFPQHMNFKFFGMQPLPTFACHDVMKNPEVEADFGRFEAHVGKYF